MSICSVYRYQYYLQLKKDVLEGRITCSLEQAIHLASLAVQGNVILLLFLLIYITGKAKYSYLTIFAAKLKSVQFSCFDSIPATETCAGLWPFPSSLSHDMSSNFCPGRRISNSAGKVISGTAIYWPGCWHSGTAEITYCQSSVQMTSWTAHRQTFLQVAVATQSCYANFASVI